MPRKVSDCREYPGMNCTLTISGEENEVLRAATRHAVEDHGMKESPDLREKIRKGLKDEKLEAAKGAA